MNQCLGKLNFVQIYLDDITIHSRTFQEHIGHIKTVLYKLRKSNLSINLKKCSWCCKEIKLLGHIIGKNTVAMDPEKISAIKDRREPKSVKDIQIFLGICGYYRKFIKDYSAIAKPLTDLLQKDKPFIWGEKQILSFNTLKEELIKEPVLKMPNFYKEFFILMHLAMR